MDERPDGSARGDSRKSPSSTPTRADWRKKGSPAAGALPSQGPWSGRWTDAKRADAGKSALLHRLKLAFWGALFLVLVGGLFYYLFFLPTRVPLIASAITEYVPLVPPNALAAEDVAGLSQTNRANMDFIGIPKEHATRDAFRAALKRQLDRAVPGGPGKKSVLLYLSAHGVLDEQNRPCLLLADSLPRDSSTWLPLAELLKDLRDHERLKRLEVKKVLILDCGRIQTNWRMGVLYNGFADGLSQVVEDLKDPNLVVLNAAGPGQTSYAAPELGNSVFGHFLAAGLEGVADSNGDGRIMLQELRNYLDESVNRWAIDNRADQQHPQLIPDTEDLDFPLAFAGTKQIPSSEPVSLPENHSATLAPLWKRHEKLRRDKVHLRNPVDWAIFEQQLERLEELSLAGSAYTAEFERVRGDIEGLLRELTSTAPTEAVALSLPLREAWSGAPPVLPKEAVRPFSQWREARAKAKPGETVPPPKLAYPVAAAAAWQWLAEANNHAQPRDVADALQFVGGSSGRGDSDLLEIHFLRMLDAYLDGPDAATGLATAIRVRDLAERAAAPVDERTQYWVKSLVDPADVRRRLAEDKLFVGDPSSLREADASWKQLLASAEASGSYAAAIRASGQVAQAYQLRDEAWSRLPALADWGVDRGRDTPPDGLDATLVQLIRSTHELGATLDASAVAGTWTPELQSTLDKTGEALRKMDKAYADRCDYLWVEAGDDQQTLRGIARVLRVPLLTGEKRNLLRDKMLRIMFAHREAGSQRGAKTPVADGAVSANPLPEDSDWLAKLTAEEHLAITVLDRAELKSRGGQLRPVRQFKPVAAKGKSPEELRRAQVESLALQGGEVRALLADVRAAAKTLVDESNQLLEAAHPEPPAVTREGFSQADRLVRAAAGLLAERTWQNSADDPSRLLQRADLHFELLWHCDRALDDFWGPTPGTKGPDFFVVAANSALNSARGLCRNAASFQYAQTDLRQLLERRKVAASAGPKPQATDLLLSEDEPDVPHRLTLTEVPDLPIGEAAAYLKLPGARGKLLERLNDERKAIRRSGLPVAAAAGSQESSYFVHNDARLEDALYLEVAALYRGHLLATPFAVGKQSRGEEVVYQRAIYEKPRIQVEGEANQVSSVIFIFDCSGSMGNEIDFERRKVPQLDVARRMLNKVLAELPSANYRIGLMIYGHTAGWRKIASDKYEPIDPQGRTTETHPSTDVKMELGLTELDDDLRDDIRKRLNRLKPLGETPLYYALTRAFAEFDSDAKSKHIIAITDGINDQTPGGPDEQVYKTRGNVETLIKAHPDITVDIVAFNMAKERIDHPKEVGDLEEIAKVAKRKLYDASNPDLLLQALQESLRRVQYSVARKAAAGPVNRLDLGRTWTFDDWDGRPGKFTVASHGLERESAVEVTLEGGEFLKLRYNTGENRLEHSRYPSPERFERRENLQDPAQADRRFYVATHMPERRGSEVSFLVSVQNADAWKFSPRPKHIWAEITPVFARPPEQVPVFHFYDLDFEPDRPVPVLRFRVPQWPAEARQAKIRLWFKVDDDAPANWTSPVEKVDKSHFPVKEIAGLQLDVQTKRGTDLSDPFIVSVTEADESPLEMYGVRLEITPAPDRIVHRYIAEARRVRHIFIYKDASALRIVQPALRATSRDRIERDAVVVEPLTVTLPQE